MLPHAVYRLDRYYLPRSLIEGLGGGSQGYQQVAQAIADGDWTEAQAALPPGGSEDRARAIIQEQKSEVSA